MSPSIEVIAPMRRPSPLFPTSVGIPFLLVTTLLLVYMSCGQGHSQAGNGASTMVQDSDSVATAVPADSIVRARISAVGDLMCHSTQYNYAKVADDTFNFHPCFDEVRAKLTGADFTIGNLETVFAGPKIAYAGYPSFNTPDDFLDALRDAGFDFLVTSNNHSMDQGGKGALRTLEQLDAYGFDHTGTYRSQADRDSVRIATVNGIEIAILNYTYGTNGRPVPEDKPWMVNEIDSTQIQKDMQAAIALDPDILLVFYHFGLENKHEPTAHQRAIVNWTIAQGADIIIGSHPHVIQPVEYFKTQNGRLDTGFVAWSLGNFLSNQYWRYTDAGVILNLEISKDTLNDTIFLSDASYVPTWVFRGKHPEKKIHMILPAERGLADSSWFYIDEEWQGKMKEAFEDTKKYLNLYEEIRLDSI